MLSLATRLVGRKIPACPLRSTDGGFVDLSTQPGRTVLFVHPGINPPDKPFPDGWLDTLGLTGCTAQASSFRDAHESFQELGVTVMGLSRQSIAAHEAARERLSLPYHLLSDNDLWFVRLLGLPAIRINGEVVAARITIVARDGEVEHARYPIPDPERDAEGVLEWLRERS